MPAANRHPDEVIAAAAAAYAVTGDIQKAADSVGLPRTTVKTWAGNNNPVFVTALADCRQQHGERIKAGLARCIDLALQRVEDGLTNGDEVVSFNKESGEVLRARKKVSAKDAAISMAIAIDKLALASGRTPQQTSEDRLQALADKLERLASPPTPAVDSDAREVKGSE